jgi:hypothetical protein
VTAGQLFEISVRRLSTQQYTVTQARDTTPQTVSPSIADRADLEIRRRFLWGSHPHNRISNHAAVRGEFVVRHEVASPAVVANGSMVSRFVAIYPVPVWDCEWAGRKCWVNQTFSNGVESGGETEAKVR